MQSARFAEPSTPPLAAAAVGAEAERPWAAAADWLAARAGAELPWAAAADPMAARAWVERSWAAAADWLAVRAGTERPWAAAADWLAARVWAERPWAAAADRMAAWAWAERPWAAAADGLAARVWAERPWPRWLQKVKSSLSTFRSLVFHLIGTPCIPEWSPPSSDLAGCPTMSVILDGAVLAFGLGAAGTIALHVLIVAGIITTYQDYLSMIYFWLTELRGLLATAAQVWDFCSGLMWLWEDMKLQQQEQQLQPSAAEQLIPGPPPPELDIC